MTLALALALLALRGAAAVLVLTTLAGGVPRVAQTALAAAIGLWAAWLAATAPDGAVLDAATAAVTSGTTAALAVAARELAIGAAIGLLAAVPLLAAATAGLLVDQASRARRGPYGALFGVLAAAVFVGVDGHVATISAIATSYRATSSAGVTAALAALIPAAARLAVPWLVTAAVVEIAAGAGARVAGRSGIHAPLAAATPAALAMITATLVGVLAIAIAHLVRAAV